MWDALEPSETQDFGYTNAGRLASASGAYGTRAWTYDAVGNVVASGVVEYKHAVGYNGRDWPAREGSRSGEPSIS